jgi:hypothetical protein
MIVPRAPFIVLAVVLAGTLEPVRPAAAPQAEEPDALVLEMQRAIQAADVQAYRALLLTPDDPAARSYADEMCLAGTTRATVKERDREHLSGSLPGEGYRLVLEILTERGRLGRIATWRVDVRLARVGPLAGRAWRIVDQERLSGFDGLYNLELNPSKQYAVKDLVFNATDLRLTVASGDAFLAETDEGMTALVVHGRGEMRFAPPDEAERIQVRLFSGSESLVTPFNDLFLRLNPADPRVRELVGALSARPVDPRSLRRAQELFAAHVRQSYSINLSDLSAATWSLAPSGQDCVAEVHTRKLGVLTYALSAGEAEDVSLFDRARRRNLAAYASAEKLKLRGRFYDEDDLNDYDVLDYRIDVTFTPDREWVEGRATVRLRVQARALASVTLNLDESLAVRSVAALGLGRLTHLRVLGQNNVIVNLPAIFPQGAELELTIAYGGRMPSQAIDREAIAVGQDPQAVQEIPEIGVPPEPYYLYSNRTRWYPRSTSGDYATATLRVTVPEDYDCVATGMQAVGSPMPAPRREPGGGAGRVFLFVAGQPVRYLACVISRFKNVSRETLDLPGGAPPGASDALGLGSIVFEVDAHARQQGRARSLRETTQNILQFYASILGDAPYPAFTLAVADSLVPGGHSPAYFAVLNQPVPTTPYRWQNDPVSFADFPSFFLAHEIAHQWWGQGVGWQNYHEQWLSEGLAQYFAAIYAERALGPQALPGLMRQMRTWSLHYADQGPIYLGYRIGHVKNDSRVFRSIIYNKSALVLHMLRRLVGDEKFFAGLRHFYRDYRFRKAGSDDLRRVMEAESGLSLERFFDRWIYGSRVPTVRFSSRTLGAHDTSEGRPAVVLRFEQVGEAFDLPVTVTLVYASGARRTIVVTLTEALTEETVFLDDRLAAVEVNPDNAALAVFTK